MEENKGYICTCRCHDKISVHMTVTCDCGEKIPSKPEPTCPPPPPKQHKCPLPNPNPQPGTVDIPQDPPFKSPTSDKPSWKQDRPKPGDPSEIPWFRGKVDGVLRNGPKLGPRKDEFLPYLLIRTSSGDRGSRPFNGVFWESPDIHVRPNQDAANASLFPPSSGGIAQAGVPNTLYAHIWNLGKSPVYRARIEFYWFNPTLGISRYDAHLIGAAWVNIADRFTLLPQWKEVNGPSGSYLTRGCHVIVRCPQTWIPTYENHGHECLVVRAFEPILDPLNPNQFSSTSNRHVAQRNIAVVQAASPAVIDMSLNLGYIQDPAEVEVSVEIDTPSSMEWLSLFTGRMDTGLQPVKNPTITGFLPPSPQGSQMLTINNISMDCLKSVLSHCERFHRGCDPLQIVFHASNQGIDAHQAQVLRIRQKVNDDIIGGYSIVLVKP